MSQTEVKDPRLASAITAIREGDQTKARSLLELAVTDDPEDDLAWQWLAVVVDSADEQQRCLYRALSINPNNETVREALRQMSEQNRALIPAPVSAPTSVPTVFQPIVYYDRAPTHRLSSYVLATVLFCVTGLGFLLIIVGSFLPWTKVSGVEMVAFEQEGYVTLITGVVGILAAAAGIWRSGCLSLLMSITAIACSLVAISVSAFNVFGVAEPNVGLGLGFILVLLGGLVSMLTSVVNSFSGLTMLSHAMGE